VGFKKGRKSKAQSDSAKRLRERKAIRDKNRRNKTTHAYGFAFFPPTRSVPKQTFQIGNFLLQPIYPLIDTLSVSNAFKDQINAYGKFAPFRFNFCCELITCEEDWTDIVIDEGGQKFDSLDPNERFKIITNVANAIILLIRLRGMTNFTIPIELTGSTFKELNQKSRSVELRSRFTQSIIDFIPGPNPHPLLLEKEDISWINDHLGHAAELNSNGGLNFIHDLYDSLHFPNPSVQLTLIWSGIESIVKSKSPGTRHSIKSRCAMLLRISQKEREDIFRKVGKLYDFRCDIIHGNKTFSMLESIRDYKENEEEVSVEGNTKLLYESYDILRELVVKIIEDKEFPIKTELDKMQNEFDELMKEND
jgi:hypothetical protein